MVRRTETEPAEHDERLGEAIEAYLALVEAGTPPDPESFAARYPDLGDDLPAALEGLALVQGLVGEPGGNGPGGRLETGHRIAGYRIVRELGRGGMGVVYEAVHVGLDRPVALKVLGSQAAPDSNGRRRFLNEARTAAELHHTHIVPVFDVGQVGGLYYYAMQRIEGSGIDRVVRHLRRDRPTAAGSTYPGATPWKNRVGIWTPWPAETRRRGSESETGPWGEGAESAGLTTGLLSGSAALTGSRAGVPPRLDRERDDGPPPFEPPRGSAYYRWVAQVGRQAAEALAHAHRRGVIHRDVKPSNLLVDGRGLIWVADFGLARRLADPGLTQHDSLLGTPRYMSPEQARVGPIDGRSDLFSLGATLYELLTLRPPFEGRSAAELVVQIRDREPARLRLTDPKIPRDLETIVLKLLSKRPADRYESAEALADDLGRFLSYEPVRARRISPAGRLWRFAQRHPGISAVSTVAAATVLTVSTVAYVRVVHERDQAEVARDDAVDARDEARKALEEAEKARNDYQVALRTNLSNGAKLLLRSFDQDRREKGLDMIKQAAALKPDARLRSTLRDDAVDFLVLRQIRALPPFPTKARGLSFGPDGSRLVLLSTPEGGGESLGVWDVARRELDRQIRNDGRDHGPGGGRGGPPGGGGGGGQPGGGPRGWPMPKVASAGQCAAVVAGGGRSVRLLDTLTGSRVRDLEAAPDHTVFAVFAAPEGQRLVTVEQVGRGGVGGGGGDRDRSSSWLVNLWDPRDASRPPKTLAEFEPDPANPKRQIPPPMVAISPDGRTVAVAQLLSTSVSVFDGETGEPSGQPIAAQAELTALALGAGGQLAAAGGGDVRLWDVDSRVPMTPLSTNHSAVRFLRFGPRGSLLAVGGWAPGVELHDAASHALVATLRTPEPAEDVAFAPDGRSFAAVGPKETLAWEVVEPDVRERIAGLDSLNRSMDFRADGLLALGGFNGPVRFWSPGGDAQSVAGTEARARPAVVAAAVASGSPTSPGYASSVAFDDRGRLVVVEPDALVVREAPPRCGEVHRVELPGTAAGMFLPQIASSPDGRVLAVWRLVAPAESARGGQGPGPGPGSRGGGTPQVLIWRSEAPDTLTVLTPPPGANVFSRRNGRPRWESIAVAPAGDRLYLLDDTGGLLAWVVEGGNVTPLPWSDGPRPEPPRGTEPPPAKAVKLAISADGRTLAVGDTRGAVTLIDTADGRARSRLDTDRPDVGGVKSLAFTPDGKELAVGTDQAGVIVWAVDAPDAPVFRLPSRGAVLSLAFDGRGRHLASAAFDKVVDVWDMTRLRDEFAGRGLAW